MDKDTMAVLDASLTPVPDAIGSPPVGRTGSHGTGWSGWAPSTRLFIHRLLGYIRATIIIAFPPVSFSPELDTRRRMGPFAAGDAATGQSAAANEHMRATCADGPGGWWEELRGSSCPRGAAGMELYRILPWIAAFLLMDCPYGGKPPLAGIGSGRTRESGNPGVDHASTRLGMTQWRRWTRVTDLIM